MKHLKSVLGKSMRAYINFIDFTELSPTVALQRLITHDGNVQLSDSVGMLSLYSKSVYEFVIANPCAVTVEASGNSDSTGFICLKVLFTDEGRVNIRPFCEHRNSETDNQIVFCLFIDIRCESEFNRFVDRAEKEELNNLHLLKADLRSYIDEYGLDTVLSEVIDHVQHVESVNFYIDDVLYTMIDRSETLYNKKTNSGYLVDLRNKPIEEFADNEILLLASLKILFISGRSVRFEEFNGLTLSATALIEKIGYLENLYKGLPGVAEPVGANNLFARAQAIREATLSAIGKTWLRYRYIYALSFYKHEKIILDRTLPPKDRDFSEFYPFAMQIGLSERELCSYTEEEFFQKIAGRCIALDANANTFSLKGSAACSYLERIIELLVGSAINLTDSDYGMSSGIRNASRLVNMDGAAVIKEMNALKPADFFTCFVISHDSKDLPEDCDEIAKSVQRRMMFNRWHFIPGNFESHEIDESRHWYYPPLIPDIADHSDVHREAHSKAMVKYSIRVPGPDMSFEPLYIGGRNYRGFYDIRVVRVEGNPFNERDLLLVQKRCEWLGVVYRTLIQYINLFANGEITFRGFQVGDYSLTKIDCADEPAVSL